LITIMTDGFENNSWLEKKDAVGLIKRFRKIGGKVILIGPGQEPFLKDCLNGQVDSIFPLTLESVHSDMTDCLSSQGYKTITECLLSQSSS
jgi:hypothetical protein